MPLILGVGADSISSDSFISSATTEALTSPDMCFTHPCLGSLFPQHDGKEEAAGGRVGDGWMEGFYDGHV